MLTIEKICVALTVPAVAVKVEAVEGKIVAAGPLMACTGLPEMAKAWQQTDAPGLNGDPEISVRLPVSGAT